ncbi:hypothetical protein A7X12_19035 [Sphingomonas sp. TDK1]|nr:hypothetical protein A7X12_19035 [Sphingomonas sp. TDK1]
MKMFARLFICVSATLMPAAVMAQTSASGTGSLTVIQPLTITKNADLQFGSVVRPVSAAGAVAVAVTGARTVTGDIQALASGDTPQAARFTISGEGGHALSVTIPASFTLANGAQSLVVTTTNNLTGALSAQTLSGTAGGAGTLDVRVGGTVALATTTPAGLYTGAFTVSTAYN